MAQEKPVYIIKNFYPYFWRKFGFPVEAGTEEECVELVKNLRKAVWVHRIVTFWHWYPFLEKHLIPMISSPEIYVSYIFFMVTTTIKNLPNIHESFLTTCSLVTAVAAYVYDKGYLEFLDYSPTILTVYFENFYTEKSGTFRICDHIQEYLVKYNYSKAYEIVEEKTERNPFADAIYSVDFVREIHFNIRSNIPVSKHATVYSHTQEVMERYKNPTKLKIITTRNVSIQTEQSLQKGLNERSTSEKDIDDVDRKRTPPLRSEKQSLQEINNKDISFGENRIEVIISNRSSSFETEQSLLENAKNQSEIESKQRFTKDNGSNNFKMPSFQLETLPLQHMVSEKDDTNVRRENAELVNAKPSSLRESKKVSPNDARKRKRLKSGETPYVEAVTDLNHVSLFQIEPVSQEMEMIKISENSKRISGEEIEDFTPKISPSPLAEQSLHNTEKLRILENGQKISTKDAEDINLELFSLTYSENPLPSVVEESGKSENEQSGNRDEAVDSLLDYIPLMGSKQTHMPRMSENIPLLQPPEFFEAVDLTISSHSKEQSFQTVEETRILNSEETESVSEDIESYSSESTIYQDDLWFEEDLTNLQSISEVQNTGDDNLKQTALLQSEENTLQDDVKKLGASESEQNTLAESSSATLAEIGMKKNCSNSIQHDETTVFRQSSAPRHLKQKKKRNKSKSKQPKATEAETTLHVPNKKAALQALIFLIRKLQNSLESIYALLNIPRNN